MKAEDFSAPETADHPTPVGAPEGVGSVEEQFQISTPGDIAQSCGVAGASPDVDTKYARCARRNHALDQFRIESMRTRIDIAEYGRNLLPLQRVRRSDKRKRRYNHFAGEAQRPDRDLQGNGPVASRDAVAHSEISLDLRLEFLHEWAVVGEPSQVKHLVDPIQEPAPVPNVRSSHMERLRKHRAAAQKRELLNLSFHVLCFDSRGWE
jgi:hypothetical protein